MVENLRSSRKQRVVEVKSSSDVTFTSPIGSPDIPIDGVNKKIYGHFNPGMARIKIEGKEIGIAISRVMTDPHDDAKRDETSHLFISTYEIGPTGIEKDNTKAIGVIDPKTLLTEEQKAAGYNLEDFRLTYLEDKNTLIACMSVVGRENLPMLGYVLAEPAMKDGKVDLKFGKVALVRDENGEVIYGKNNIMRVAKKDGSTVMMYRPEFLDGKKTVNFNKFRFLSVDIENPDKRSSHLKRELVMPQIEDDSKYPGRWGWNGNNGQNDLKDEEGNSICICHYDQKKPLPITHPDLDDRYTFKLVVMIDMDDGTVEWDRVYTDDFLTPEVVEQFTGTGNALNPKKRVIYSCGSDANQKTKTISIGAASEDTLWVYANASGSYVNRFMEGNFIKNPRLEIAKGTLAA